jgi:DNA-binding protein HU-beta
VIYDVKEVRRKIPSLRYFFIDISRRVSYSGKQDSRLCKVIIQNNLRRERKELTTMTKGELISVVARAAKMSKRGAESAVDATFAALARAIKKDKRFQLPAFGTFSVKSRQARIGRNPRTGEVINIKASRTVGFKPAPRLKKGL